MQSIDVLVASPNPQRLFDVAMLITVNDGAKLLQDQLCHVSQLNRNLVGKLLASDLLRALGDVAGKVADALKIACDPQRANDLAQIDRERLTPRNSFDRLGFDCSF